MLRELHISELGVIRDLDLEFDPGLNVLSGETGAGKTMVTVGLALALGGRASAVMVRRGAGVARIQARFDAPEGADDVGWSEDGELILARSVSADGRGSARIGGQLAPVSALARVAGDLVEMHGQHQGLRLLSPAAQTEFLDRFAGPEHRRRVVAFGELHGRLRNVRARIEELTATSRERERQIDLLAYQVREIESASIRLGERAELQAEEVRLGHAESLVERAAEAGRILGEEPSAVDALGAAAGELELAAQVDPRVAELAGRARSLAEEATDLARGIRAYREGIEIDPERLETVRDRIQALQDLQRKYGDGEQDVLAYLAEAREQLAALGGSDEEARLLQDQAGELELRCETAAGEISKARSEAAPQLADAVAREVRELGIEEASVEVALRSLAETGPAGAERAEFLFSGGAGQQPLPLSKVASGGELSRTMLACRSALVDLDDVPTLVFDEVDVGIGGRAAAAVGRRLARLARSRQVLVVTHLPQIAAFADRHVRVEKVGGTASVRTLQGPERVAELSRMLSGLPGSGSAAVHAEELLAEAARLKRGAGGPAVAPRSGAARRASG